MTKAFFDLHEFVFRKGAILWMVQTAAAVFGKPKERAHIVERHAAFPGMLDELEPPQVGG